MKNWVKHFVAALVVSMSAVAANAEAYRFDYGTWIGTSGPSYQPSQTFARLDVSTTDNLSYLFSLDVFGNLNSLFGSGSYIDAAVFNSINGSTPSSTSIASGLWGVDDVVASSNAPNVGGITFDFKDKFGNAKASRLTQGESVEWVATFNSAQPIPLFGSPTSALHVAGFDESITNGVNSGWYAPTNVVSEPGSMLLVAFGILGLFAFRRSMK